MTLFNHMELAEKLGRGELTETEKFYYYLASLGIILVFYDNYSLYEIYMNESSRISHYTGPVIHAVLSVAAAIIAFRLNASGDNKDFIARMICLGVPLWIQARLLSISTHLILSIAGLGREASYDLRPRATGEVVLAVYIAVELYYCVQLVRGMHRAANLSTGSNSAAVG